MQKTIFTCDMCKRQCEETELLKIWFAMPDAPGMKALSQMRLMQGTRLGDEDLCPECYQRFCWAFANLMSGEITPHNPVKEL